MTQKNTKTKVEPDIAALFFPSSSSNATQQFVALTETTFSFDFLLCDTD